MAPPNDESSYTFPLPILPHTTSPSPSSSPSASASASSKPTIRLLGAGPGDPDLLTVKALRLLQSKDLLVVSDNLVPRPILDLVQGELYIAPPKKRGLAAKKPDSQGQDHPQNQPQNHLQAQNQPQNRSLEQNQPQERPLEQPSPKPRFVADESQSELMRVALAGLQAGREVLRLKNGDPFVFGRGGEELLFFRAHGFHVDVIPGISSALAAPLAAQIPVTHRGVADQVLITTGQGREGSVPDLPPFARNRTTVFLMPVARLEGLVSGLLALGYPPDLPVAIVERATFPQQRVVEALLEEMPRVARREGVESPATIVVGHVVKALAPGVPSAFL